MLLTIHARLYWLTYNQIDNNIITQASTLALHSVPNDLLQNIDPLAIMILVPCKLTIWMYAQEMRY